MTITQPLCFKKPTSKKNTWLVLQEEELDEHNNQATPPGFHLIFLPYADDFRKLKYEKTPKGRAELQLFYKHTKCREKPLASSIAKIYFG